MTHNTTQRSRRTVLRHGAVLAGAGVLGLAQFGSAAADPGKPDFSPRVWGDGEQWGTKVTGTFEEPEKKHNLDKLFVLTTDHEHPPGHEHQGHHPHPLPDGQLPVSEAAPGNPAYNGGRWWTHTATWTHQGIHDHGGSVPLLTRYGPADDPSSILFHERLGHIEITEGSPDATPDFFRCPLLTVKDE